MNVYTHMYIHFFKLNDSATFLPLKEAQGEKVWCNSVRYV